MRDMQVVTVATTGRDRKFAYSYKEDVTGTGDWVLIPEDINSISVSLVLQNGARGKIQTFIGEVGETVIPEDWPHGEVSINTLDVCAPVTMIRALNTNSTGNVKFRMRAQ